MTHKELIEKLIYDENISDNIDVCTSYEPDQYGNNMVTMSFEGIDVDNEKGADGMLILLFNDKGRMVSMEIATCKKKSKKSKKPEEWQIASSRKFINFKRVITGVDH